MDITTTAQQTDTDSNEERPVQPEQTRLTIRARIMSTFGLLILLMLGAAAVIWFSYTSANSGGDAAVTQQTAVAQLSVNAQRNLLSARTHEKNYLIAPPTLDADTQQGQFVNPLITDAAQIRQRGIELRLLLEQSGGTAAELEEVDAIMAAVDRYESSFLALVEARNADPAVDITPQQMAMDAAAQTISEGLNLLGETSADRAAQSWSTSQLIGQLGATVTIVLLGAVALISIFMGWRLHRLISQPLKAAAASANSYLEGEGFTPLDAAKQPAEIRPLLDHLNQILSLEAERDAADEAAQAEREDGLSQLNQVVLAAAFGDLTHNIESPLDETAELSQTINQLFRELRQYIREIQQALGQIHKASDALHGTAKILTDDSHKQSQHLSGLTTTADQISGSLTRMAKSTIESQKVGQKMGRHAAVSQKAVKNSASGMERIRQQIQETAKQMKQLGERSQEIGEMRRTMGEVAEQLSLLALNASIKSRVALSGTDPQGLGHLTEQIDQISKRAATAVSEIEPLIEALQQDASTVIAAVETTTAEVVNGSKLVSETGQAFQEIDTSSAQLATLIEAIVQDTKRQAKTTIQLNNQIKQIKQLLKTHTTHMEKLTAATNGMGRLVDSFDQTVQQFKLPANPTAE